MKKYVVVVISLVLVLCVGVSYSYFTSDINNKESKLKISSKDLSIVLTDNMELNSNDISPGWSDSKTFTIKNNSNGSYNYNIVLKDLVNTFVTEGFLQYKITSTNGYNTEGYINIPKSDSPQDIVIGYDIDIEKDITQEYQIEFVYRDSEEIDQSEDMGKIFKGTLAIEEGTVNPNIKYSIRLNVENAIVDNNIKETIKRGSVEFNVVPDEGYTLGTTVTCDNNANGVIEDGKVTISNVTANTICSLNNEINTYTIEMKVVNGKSNALNKIIEYNGSDSFTITPNTGYSLTGATLTGEGCSIEGNIVRVSNVKKDGVCTLTLPKDKYQVILTGNNVTVSDSPKTVEYKGDVTFNVSPNTGFTMSEASVNCDGGASTSINGNTVTISNVLKGQTCTIAPKQLKYDVTLVVVNGTGNTTKTIAHGGSDTFNISANSTYTLDNPSVSCTGSASTSYNNGVLTVSNVTGIQTCTVTLKHTSYTVSVTSNNNSYGTVSPTSQSVIHGNSATITLSPKSGYKYLSNTCGGTVDGNTMTISNITTSNTCNVTFEKITYNVKVISNSTTMGTVSVNSNPIEHGNALTITLSPKTSSYVYLSSSCVTDYGGIYNGINNTITVNGVNKDINCTVTFAEKKTLLSTLMDDTKYSKIERTDFSTVMGGTSIEELSPATDKNKKKIYYTNSTDGKEDGVLIYYFSGNVEDNWVKFAGAYWRIIRTNADESIRLLYAGSEEQGTNTTNGILSEMVYGSGNNDNALIWGSSSLNNSSVEGSVAKWYATNITNNENNNSMVSKTAIYCNDMSVSNKSGDRIYHSTYNRLVRRVMLPTFSCKGKKYTNGYGLITADELAFAGGHTQYDSPNVYYIRNSVSSGCVESSSQCLTGISRMGSTFTMSPWQYYGYPYIFSFDSTGKLNNVFAMFPGGNINYYQYGVRPVISLNKDVKVLPTQDGTALNPYIPSLD